ncbi:MAG: hypothetical protein HY901_38025 [Deltaproteobacteria bacterium]|nr:hypothetical protein [Deltaproteobacteria bacterium]
MLTPRLVRAVAAAGAFLCAALAAKPAQAQFANHSIGFEAGYVYVANPAAQNVGSGFDLGVNSTLYIESGFDLYFRILVGIHKQRLPEQNVVGILPAVGFRYLFSEDTVRPYLGLNLAYQAYITDEYSSRFALAPQAGIEFFVAENFSIGFQTEYHLVLSLNAPPEHGVIGLGRVGWYF